MSFVEAPIGRMAEDRLLASNGLFPGKDDQNVWGETARKNRGGVSCEGGQSTASTLACTA